jgi:H+/Cl- antiporter ClcA
MSPISMKKVLIAILIVIGLSRVDVIVGFIHHIYEGIYDSLAPVMRNFSTGERYVLVLMLGALLYISFYKLLYERMKKR